MKRETLTQASLILAATKCDFCKSDLEKYGNSGMDQHDSCGHYYHTRGLGGGEGHCNAGDIWDAYCEVPEEKP